MTNQVQGKFGKDLKWETDVEFVFPDGLKIRKIGDGHKRPMRGGPTLGWVVIVTSHGKSTKEFTLYVSGVEGKPKENEYDRVIFLGHSISLRPNARFRVSEKVNIKNGENNPEEPPSPPPEHH